MRGEEGRGGARRDEETHTKQLSRPHRPSSSPREVQIGIWGPADLMREAIRRCEHAIKTTREVQIGTWGPADRRVCATRGELRVGLGLG